MSRAFAAFAAKASNAVGHWVAFAAALSLVVSWLVGGFFVGFSDTTYQLLINTSTTIITFLMVFLIQSTQNRDNLATNVKLDELIRVTEARNQLRDIEDADPERLRQADEARKGN